MGSSALSFIALALSGLAVLVLALGWLRQGRGMAPPMPGARAALLFEGEKLVDAAGLTAAADRLHDAARQGRRAALALLGEHFPTLESRLAAAEGDIRITLAARTGTDRLVVERRDAFTRLTLTSEPEPGTGLHIAALERELQVLRTISKECPQPIWREDGQGRVIWANRAYLDLADRLLVTDGEDAPPWPLQPLFGAAGAALLTLPGEEEPRHFDITRHSRDGVTTGFASDVTRIHLAEEAREVFVQTLTRTFAELQTGLAVFDRRRRLVLFNPAFADLTGLKPDFLARRPHVRGLLDRLRETQVLPEPRDWPGWRDRIATLESRAEEGSYRENWPLPDGRTFRITGRPHPDGALAFFLEDISDSITLSRHLRRDHATMQAVLDHLPQALALFSAAGSMVLCNAAYQQLWGIRPDRPEDLTFAQELTRWRAAANRDLWPGIEGQRRQQAMQEGMVTVEGQSLHARLTALGGGRLVVEFEGQEAAVRPAAPREARPADGARRNPSARRRPKRTGPTLEEEAGSA